jgi:hypothetical protein
MKQFFLFLSLTVCASAFATVRTVSNNPGLVAQYSTIQAAVNASASGDTVYVNGSNIQYAAFTITDKRLTVIGPGWSPMQNFMAFQATVSDITITGTNSSNTEIQGLEIMTSVTIASANHPDNMRFVRNHLHGSVSIYYGTSTFSGYVFEGNWFDGAGIGAAPGCFYINFLFKNNIFYALYNGGNASGLYQCNNVLFDHNLWYGPSSGSSYCFGSNCRYLSLTNNIFVRRDAAANNTFSTFNNNITYNCGVNNPWAQNGNTATPGTNVENQDPQMASQAAVNIGTNNPLLDFTIATGPANNLGTDGKDMGLMYDASGSYNWTNSRMSRLPFVYSMNISNPNIPVGGTLNVQVEARKNN